MLRVFLCILLANRSNAEQGNHQRIVSGLVAKPNQFPHHVAILYDGQFVCGGSIISAHKVLTAGHCIVSVRIWYGHPSKLSISFGGNDLTYLEFEMDVDRVALHPKFKILSRYYIENDLSMLFLVDEIPQSTLRLIGLQSALIPSHTQCTVVGWGRHKDGSTENMLNYGYVLIDIVEKCNLVFKVCNNPDSVCAGYNDSTTPCTGDSGGSLICNNLATGIVSFGMTDCKLGSPVIYANISNHLDWINSDRANLICLDFRIYILYLILINTIL